jgi:hypothetical protein
VTLDPVVDLTLRALLALLFATSALAKLRDPRGFAAAVAGYRLLPAALAAPAAAGFLAAEVALAAALGLPPLRDLAALGAAALLALYGFAIAWNLARGRRDIDCGCGGPFGRTPLSEALVARNLLLVAAALALLLPAGARPLAWLDALTLAAAVGSACLLWAAAHALLRPAAAP